MNLETNYILKLIESIRNDDVECFEALINEKIILSLNDSGFLEAENKMKYLIDLRNLLIADFYPDDANGWCDSVVYAILVFKAKNICSFLAKCEYGNVFLDRLDDNKELILKKNSYWGAEASILYMVAEMDISKMRDWIKILGKEKWITFLTESVDMDGSNLINGLKVNLLRDPSDILKVFLEEGILDAKQVMQQLKIAKEMDVDSSIIQNKMFTDDTLILAETFELKENITSKSFKKAVSL